MARHHIVIERIIRYFTATAPTLGGRAIKLKMPVSSPYKAAACVAFARKLPKASAYPLDADLRASLVSKFDIPAMASVFKKWFKSKAVTQNYRVPPGDRIYAVGDIHGRLDLFEQLVSEIEADDADRGGANTTIVLLGDLVDRGPASSGVVGAAIELGTRRRVRTICGNHEEMLLKSLEDVKYMRAFLSHGGRETVLSYLRNSVDYNSLSFDELFMELHSTIPQDHLNFLRDLEDKVIIGDYLFVHAGVRPGIDIGDQALADLRWIREPFLSVDHSCGYCVVHGHTISDEPEVRPGRIGIDTGAYQSGKLTALGLEGAERWFLSTH